MCLMPRPPEWMSASNYRYCRHRFGGARHRTEIANIALRQLADPAVHQLHQIEDEVGRAHLRHSAIRRLGADEGAVLRQLVNRLAAAADRESKNTHSARGTMRHRHRWSCHMRRRTGPIAISVS